MSTSHTIGASDAARELISREFSRMNFEIILENEFSILEKWRKYKSTLICRFGDSDEEKQEKTREATVSLFHIFFLFLFSLINDTHGSLNNKIATILVATFGGYLWWPPLVATFGGYLWRLDDGTRCFKRCCSKEIPSNI